MYCQNYIMSRRDYCGEPALDLGIKGLRNLCLSCHLKTLTFREQLIRQFVLEVESTSWLETARLSEAGQRDYLARLLTSGARLSDIYRARHQWTANLELMEAVSANDTHR